jgi:AraC-like DNA-binding protein
VEQYVTRDRFGDFGQYREQLRCWDTEAVQLSRGHLTIEFDRFDAGDLVLSHLKFDRNATFRSSRDSGWHALVVDVSPKRWCGIDLAPGSFLALAPRRETHVVSQEPWESIAINVRSETLAGWESPLAELADWSSAPEASILASDQAGVARFRSWVEAFFSSPLMISAKEDATLWSSAIRERLKHHLLDVLGHRATPTPVLAVHRVARYDLALAALRMIQPDTEHRVTVADLAEGLGVSVRAVEYAFNSVIGVSPAQYVLAERLNKARHHLMTFGSSGGTVTTVAFDHQFENLSRFAQHYARLFGERPSDTLRTARSAFCNA